MARAETANLNATLTLTDNLSGPLKAAKAGVDATAQSVESFDQKLAGARTGIARFASAGSQLALVGSTIGGSFGGAVGPLSDFIRVAGNIGLVASTVADLGGAARTTSVAVTELAAAQNAAGVASTGFLTRFGPLAVVLTALAASLANLVGEHEREDFALNRSRDALVAYVNGGKDAADTSRNVADQAQHAADSMVGLTTETTKLADAFTLLGTSVDSQDVVDTVAAAQQGIGVFGDLAGGVEATGTAGSKTADQLDRIVGDIAFLSEHDQLQIAINVTAAGSGVGLIPGGTPDTFVAGNTDNPPPSSGNLPFGSSNAKVIADAAAAAAKAAAEAARKAAEEARRLAAVYHDRVQAEFDVARRTADTLFDALHRRNIQAIDDAEKLAQTRHDNTAQAIADQLKLEQAQHAAPVEAAQRALDERQAVQQRRDLIEAQQAAAQELQKNTDPTRTEGLARALRAATEALQNFDASATIGRLQDIQTQQDAASEKRARDAAGINDAELAAAKQAADIARDAETIADQKRRQRFELELAALQKRDEAAKKSPADIQKDIDALSARFGITVDPITGFHHITDPLVTAIKNVKIEPKVTLNNNQTFRLVIGPHELALIANAVNSSKQPQSTASTRNGGTPR